MKLRQKFGFVAWIYVLSLSVNLVMSCWTIIAYFESTFASFHDDLGQQNAAESTHRMALELVADLEQDRQEKEYRADSAATLDEIRYKLQPLAEQVDDQQMHEVWVNAARTLEQCRQIAARREATSVPDSSNRSEAASLLDQEIALTQRLAGQLSRATRQLDDRRWETVRQAPKRTQIVLTILAANALVGSVLCVLGIALLRKWVILPIFDLRNATREIGAGHFEYRINNPTQDEIGDLAREVNHMTETISTMQTQMVEQERLAAAGEMVTRLAHNIRNPLAGIRGLAEATAAANTDDTDTVECQQRIIDTVDRFEKWLRDLQQSVSPLELRLQDVVVEQLARDVVTALRPMLDRRQIEVSIEIDPDVQVVQIDALHFEQAVVSLVTNAVQASKPGQRVRMIMEPVTDSEQQWQMTVEDEGEGIPEEIREKIFQPYFTTKPDGNGLGLAMVNKVVKIHGGRLSVESEVGHGSRFTAVMPGRVRAAAAQPVES